MKKVLIAVIAISSLLADDIAPPANIQKMRPRIPHQEEKTSRLLISGDFLYWIPSLEGLTFANQSFPTERKQYDEVTGQTQTIKTQGSRPLEIEGNWEPGIRISMGYLFDEKGWDTILNWTYFKNDPATKATSKPDHRLTPTASPDSGFYSTFVDTAKGKWHLDQNIADLEVGKTIHVGDFFHTRPFFGVRGARIRNKEDLSYSVQITDFSSTAQISFKSSYWGSGPRLGGSVTYDIGRGVGAFALGSASLLMGQIASTGQSSAFHTVSTMQMQIGCQWERTFRNKYHFGLQTAWEQNFFSGVTRYLPQAKEKSMFMDNNDLTVKGLTASCHLNF